MNVYFFQTNNDPSRLRFEEQDIVNETRIRLDKKDIDNILERKHNEARSANMVRSGYYTGTPRPVSAPAPAQPQPHPPPPPPHPQYPPRNMIPMMPQGYNMQRHMGSMGGIGAMRRR